MKQLTCEMCGSTDLIKQDGVFVCQVCGCKYSIEEARKMMIEGIVEVTGTVKVDNSSSINNYLELVHNALDHENYAEAESYCNRIIEINAKHWEAWKLKAKAVGYQSTTTSPRIKEAVSAYARAFENCPEEMQSSFVEDSVKEIEQLYSDYIKVKTESILNHLSSDDTQAPKVLELLLAYGELYEFSKDVEEQIRQNKNIHPDLINKFFSFKPNSDGGLLYTTVISERIGKAVQLLKGRYLKIDRPDADIETDVVNAIVTMSRMESFIPSLLLGKNSNEYKYDDPIKNTIITSSLQLAIDITQVATILHYYKQVESKIEKIRDDYRKELEKYNKLISTGMIEISKRRTEDYWNSHKEEREQFTIEKEQLISEQSQLQDYISKLENNKQFVPAKQSFDDIDGRILSAKNYKKGLPVLAEKDRLEATISQLKTKQSSLGIFKRKEKNEIGYQIENLQRRLSDLHKTIDYQILEIDKQIAAMESEKNILQPIVLQQQSEIEKRIAPYRERMKAIMTRIDKIDNELTKPR